MATPEQLQRRIETLLYEEDRNLLPELEKIRVKLKDIQKACRETPVDKAKIDGLWKEILSLKDGTVSRYRTQYETNWGYVTADVRDLEIQE